MKMVKAKSLFDTKKFNLGDNCAIVIDGRINGRLADLKPNDKLVSAMTKSTGSMWRTGLRWWKTQTTEAPRGSQ